MSGNHPASTSGARLLVSILAAMLLVQLAVSPAVAMQPTGGYAVFNRCPRFTPGVQLCLYSEIGSGTVAIGYSKVVISHAIYLQGGLILEEGGESFVGATNGETLSKAPQPVAGGLLGMISPSSLPLSLRARFEESVRKGLTGVTSTTELAKPASSIKVSRFSLIFEEGIGLVLPVKVHLENPFLGSQCYIGSGANPITLNLTSAETSPPPPNKPIHGQGGTLKFEDEGARLTLAGQRLVDNSFPVPRSNGCGGVFSSVIGPIIDAKLGLPSAAGHNTFIQNGTVEVAAVEVVRQSEK